MGLDVSGSGYLVCPSQSPELETFWKFSFQLVRSFIQNGAYFENVEFWQRLVYQIGFTIVPGLLMLVCFIWIKCTYKITEENHEIMVLEIEKRHNNDSKQ